MPHSISMPAMEQLATQWASQEPSALIGSGGGSGEEEVGRHRRGGAADGPVDLCGKCGKGGGEGGGLCHTARTESAVRRGEVHGAGRRSARCAWGVRPTLGAVETCVGRMHLYLYIHMRPTLEAVETLQSLHSEEFSAWIVVAYLCGSHASLLIHTYA